MVSIGEIKCKGAMNKSGIKGVDYAVNPFIGCSHGCVYCYARFMTRWYHKGEPWGSFVDVKKNIVSLIKKEANKKKPGMILFSSVTDAYQPVEKKANVTRGCLEVLVEHDFPVEILTKSSLVTRDIDIISRIDQVEVGLTVTGYNDDVRRVFEPGASSVKGRLDSLKMFSDSGIETYAFLGPLLPYLCEDKIEDLMNFLVETVSRVLVDRLNIKAGNWKSIKLALKEHYPELEVKFKKASQVNSPYYEKLRREVKKMLELRSIPADIIF